MDEASVVYACVVDGSERLGCPPVVASLWEIVLRLM